MIHSFYDNRRADFAIFIEFKVIVAKEAQFIRPRIILHLHNTKLLSVLGDFRFISHNESTESKLLVEFTGIVGQILNLHIAAIFQFEIVGIEWVSR